MLKPFLVGLLQKKFQENKFRIPKHDESLINQLLAYRVLRTTLQTIKYTTHNEHIVDCCLYAMYGIWLLYENEFESKFGKDQSGIRVFNDQNIPVQQFQQDAFWGALDGPRLNYPGVQIPRTSIDAPYSKSPSQAIKDFYRDD